MTDRELLELAAKAGGIIGEYESWTGQGFKDGIRQVINGAKCLRPWNPLADDGDALRLAAHLKIDIEWQATNPFPDPRVEAYQRDDGGRYFCADEHEDYYRRAIVRSAAKIGKAMQQEKRRTTP